MCFLSVFFSCLLFFQAIFFLAFWRMSFISRVSPYLFRRISPSVRGHNGVGAGLLSPSRSSPLLSTVVTPSFFSTQTTLLSSSSSVTCSSSPFSFPPSAPLPQRFFSSPSHPPTGDDLVWYGAQQFLSDNKVDEAIETIENGLQENKESVFLLSRLADIHMATSQFDKVIEACDRAIALPKVGGNEKDDFLAMQGEAYDRLKNFEMARQKYEEVLQNNPANSLICQRLAYLHLSSTDWLNNPSEKYQGVVEAFDRSIALSQDDPENHYGRGLAFFYGREFEEAIGAFKNATDLDPKYAPAWQKMSLAHMVRKEFEASIYAADHFFDSAKDYYSKLSVDLTFGVDAVIFDLMLKRGICYLMLKDYRMVIGCMEVMLEGGKDIPKEVKTEALGLQAQAHFEEGGYWECVKCASECIQVDNEYYPAYKVRSDAYEALGRKESAEEDREMCIRLAGKHHEASS